MLHVVHLIERRFPGKSSRIVALLALSSAALLAVGAGLSRL